jgi:hypothetical protein
MMIFAITIRQSNNNQDLSLKPVVINTWLGSAKRNHPYYSTVTLVNKEGNSFTAIQAKENATLVPAIGVLNEKKKLKIRMKTGESAVNSEFVTHLNNECYCI